MVMALTPKNGLSLVGGIFLLLGLLKLLNGGPWVVWIILGLLFGGMGLFRRKREAN
jgi:hypothetical protein